MNYENHAPLLYAGIGARDVNDTFFSQLMTTTATRLAVAGWTLRSGAAPGSDSHFETGTDLGHGKKEIMVPWNGFSNRYIPNVIAPKFTDRHRAIASEHHTAWDKLSKSVQNLMMRNVCIILGEHLDSPVKFVIAYTNPDNKKRADGGTGHAMRIAQAHGIEIVNIADPFMRREFAVQRELVRLARPHEVAREKARKLSTT